MFFLAAFEFPQINYRLYNGKKYNTVYGIAGFSIDKEDAVSFSQRTLGHADSIIDYTVFTL